VIRNVAPGVEDSDAVNLAQLNSIIDTKLGVIENGTY
jgi:autotransporter adhesin